MYCNQCGQKNSDNSKFCSNCGNKLEFPNFQSSNQIRHVEELQKPRNSKIELWNPNATANWSLIFTPIFGSYLQMKNWQTLGKHEEANKALIWLISTVVFILFINFGTQLIWSDIEQASSMSKGLGFWYIIIWYFAYAKKQPKYVKEILKDTYEKKSWLIPLVSATILLFIITFIFMILK